jgi:enoyl-CoA hydratase/carnithine racemase
MTDDFFFCSELGCATHFVPSRRISSLINQLSAFDTTSLSLIDQAIEELSSERQLEDLPSPLTGSARMALDYAFRHDNVEGIFKDLELMTKHQDTTVRDFAISTLSKLETRSPTSLKVALKAIRKGRSMNLLQALNMELKMATAYCVRWLFEKPKSPTDFWVISTKQALISPRACRPCSSQKLTRKVPDHLGTQQP